MRNGEAPIRHSHLVPHFSDVHGTLYTGGAVSFFRENGMNILSDVEIGPFRRPMAELRLTFVLTVGVSVASGLGPCRPRQRRIGSVDCLCAGVG